MKSFNMHSSKHSKRNKHRRNNVMKNAVSRDRIPPQIFNTYAKNENHENVKRISKNIQFINPIGLKTNYPKDFAPIYFSTEQTKSPEVKRCTEIMTLLPFNNRNRHQNVNNKIVRANSTLLARITMNALAASETDVNAILELVETMYNSIQEMLQDLKQKQQIYKPSRTIVQEPKYVIKIDVKKFVKYLNEQYIRNTGTLLRNGNNQDLIPRKQPCICKPTNTCRSFNILLQPRRMSFNISVFKFNSCSMDFFQRLASFYNSCNTIHNTANRKQVPSVFIRDWHFRNVSQGYLLSVLLKHNNVMSLNVMRKLYFVIITSVTPNLTIEINFKLANGIFTVYDTPPFEKLPFQVIHWNDRHRNILETFSRILYAPFTYNVPHKDDELNDLQRDTKSDNTLQNNRSTSDSSSTLKYESSSEYEGSDYFIRSTSYSELGFVNLKSTESSTDLTFKESVKTLTLSIDDMLSFHALLNNRKDCGDMNFTSMLQEQYNMCHSTIKQGRTWMSKICSDSAKLKAEVIAPYLNSILNETVFDRMTSSIGAFTQHWARFESQTFCKTVFKDLGNYLMHTMFISILYY